MPEIFFVTKWKAEMFALEKYQGMKTRHACPGCGHKRVFVRYVNENGEYLADNAGRCNRESKCSYHYSPKMYFADHPEASNHPDHAGTKSRRRVKKPVVEAPRIPQFFHSRKLLESTLGHSNNFLQFLFDLFPDDPDGVCHAADRYYIGTFNVSSNPERRDLLTCFWQIDVKGRIRKGKLMRYNPKTGKRQPVFSWIEEGEQIEIPTYWVHKALQKRNELPEEVNFQNCFFGEHLLRLERHKTVAIVEAEKTAVICSMYFPDLTWIAVGAQRHLKGDKLQVLQNRQVILYPDADAFEVWREKTVELQRMGIQTRLSAAIDQHALPKEKENGYDLADYLIAEQRRINASIETFEPSFNGSFIPPAIQTDNARRIVESVF